MWYLCLPPITTANTTMSRENILAGVKIEGGTGCVLGGSMRIFVGGSDSSLGLIGEVSLGLLGFVLDLLPEN